MKNSKHTPQQQYIEIKGARVNNLRNISVNIPIGKLVCITGVSGSGKTSLAFDTLYAEGQRRYVESLSAYARQFLGRMSKPECDFIKNLPPAIAIQQKVIARNPRSTVGTTTEIYDYLRLLFAKVGHTYSPITGEEVRQHTPDDVVQCMLRMPEGTRLLLLVPLIIHKGRTLLQQLDVIIRQGYTRILYEGQVIDIQDILDMPVAADSIDPARAYIIIDRLNASSARETVSRLTDSAETAFFQGEGQCILLEHDTATEHHFSSSMEEDGIQYIQPNENLFSFNSPVGSCPTCQGFGKIIGIDPTLVIPNPTLSVYDGCVQCWHGEKLSVWQQEFIRRAAVDDFPIFTPYNKLTRRQQRQLWEGLPSDLRTHGAREVVSINHFFQMVRENQYKIQYRVLLARYRGRTTCPDCHGTRLRKEASYVKIAGHTINDLVEMPADRLLRLMEGLQLPQHEMAVARRVLTEITTRLHFLIDTGLDYLTLNRPSNTLSGGESQRINLCTSLGSPLVGSLYVLDEPSIGLHPADTQRLIGVLRQLRDAGNTVVVVEHDEDILRAADHIIDIGPDAGEHGGQIVWQGSAESINDIRQQQSDSIGSIRQQQSDSIASIGEGQLHTIASVGEGQSHTINSVGEGQSHTINSVDQQQSDSNNSVEQQQSDSNNSVEQQQSDSNNSVGQQQSHTIDYLTHRATIPVPTLRRPANDFITVSGCTLNNLKGITLRVPLHTLTAVTGVSGSGKTSLIRHTLYPIILRQLGQPAPQPGGYDSVSGDIKEIKAVEMVDQNPIGASTRSNAATYLKAYDLIRQLMAQQPLARQLNITPQHFSFNADGGRCEECKGSGITTIEMQFMADLSLTCPSCHGERFKREVLQVTYCKRNINDILRMTVDQAIAFFSEQKELTDDRPTANLLGNIIARLMPLRQVGLGYIQLGQPSSTLSGGENQRVKLAYHIAQEDAGHTLFIFDEPTTGLHFHDISRLLQAFDTLIRHGHSIIVIEHNMDVIKSADYVIDLGPKGGEAGGQIVAEGTPEEVVEKSDGATATHLRERLQREA